MNIIKAFARGFAKGWRENAKFDLAEFIAGAINSGLVILFWEWLNGRLL